MPLKEPPRERSRHVTRTLTGDPLVDKLRANKRRRQKAADEMERARAELGRILKHGLNNELMGVYGMARIAGISRQLASQLINNHAPSTRIGRPPTPKRRNV